MSNTLSSDLALLLLRVALGVFFAISGYHKIFNAQRHLVFVGTLKANGVYNHFTEWSVPTVEFLGGCALIVGLLTPLAATGLGVIIFTAIYTDCTKRLQELQPIDRADAVCDFLYLPESMYAVMLVVLILSGPGIYSLDCTIAGLL